ncbi:thiamine ABC transporter substrate binding subunit [uncultured Nocardioides sp.]|nr:thiamine ABC transporter substrate-binding protein [uncultured Nocardioides sp.]MAY96780.1 thiamine ABC transporter substrate-binding protein [Nocardioides sp.]|tara:strand:- start:122 stop:1192 length:1071 start_codon:yes stop_codon:yes gene_type:complete
MTVSGVLGALLLTSCSLIGTGDDDSAADPSTGTSGGTVTGGPVVLVTHDSFSLPKKLVKQFEADTGYELELRSNGDAGSMTSQLVLNVDNPLGDVAFGVDNTFAGRALEAGVFAPYRGEWPAGVEDFALPGDDEGVLTPVDNGDVCVNVDTAWFDEQGLEPPQTLEDLTDPAYEDLFVTSGATTSSPGFAFLLATIAAYGEDWPAYWEDLLDNGAKVVPGWEDAYFVDFTAGGGGARPIVLSYDSSPAFTTTDDGSETTTAALLETCFEQVEYVGVLAGAENPTGAQAVVDWMLTPEVQAALPDSMYVFPVVDGVEMPEAWAEFAPRPEEPLAVDAAEIDENRDAWLTEWQDLVSR